MNIHADLIEQYAQDWKETDKPWRRWERRCLSETGYLGSWHSFEQHPTWESDWGYRRKPRTFMVGDVEVRPVQGRLERGVRYYCACPTNSVFYFSFEFDGESARRKQQERGLIHTTQQDAIAHGKALAALTGGE